jgi:hypothetical protein
MTDPLGDDRTRDIHLPPLAGRPPSALPREWAETQAHPRALTPEVAAPTPDGPPPPPDAHVADRAAPVPLRHGGALADQVTDQLGQPDARPRERTIAFASPEMAGGRPAPTVGPTARRRRWPWVVLTLLPVLVIATAGIMLFLLLRGG